MKPPKSGTYRGVGLVAGTGEGLALVTREGLAFNLGVDERTGIVIEAGHELEGRSVAGKVVICQSGKGSSAGSFSLLQLAARGLAPAAIVNIQAEAVVVAGAVLAKIPLVHRLDVDPTAAISSGQRVRVDGTTGEVRVS
jgi:predicted aconitase with swiveling domain